jgi:hypothetical protein
MELVRLGIGGQERDPEPHDWKHHWLEFQPADAGGDRHHGFHFLLLHINKVSRSDLTSAKRERKLKLGKLSLIQPPQISGSVGGTTADTRGFCR